MKDPEVIRRCYRRLDLRPGAPPDEIKSAYRHMSQAWHPDNFPDDPEMRSEAKERFQKINRAYQILSNCSREERHQVREESDLTEWTILGGARAFQDDRTASRESDPTSSSSEHAGNQSAFVLDSFERGLVMCGFIISVLGLPLAEESVFGFLGHVVVTFSLIGLMIWAGRAPNISQA